VDTKKISQRMSAIDLVILGILMEKPRNAYDLTQFIGVSGIDRMIKVSSPAVYKNCKKLKQSGFIDAEVVKDSEMPEKVVYSMNESGREFFFKLMGYFSKDLKPFYFDFNAFLLNIGRLSFEQGLQHMENLETNLQSLHKGILMHEEQVQAVAPFHARSIVKQYRMLASTLVEWIGQIKQEYINMQE